MTGGSLIGRALRAWEWFWFRDIPGEVYAVLRMLVGALGLIALLVVTPISTFWSLDGLIPVSGDGSTLRNLAGAAGFSDATGLVLFLGLLISFACMTIGYRSAWAVAGCFGGSVFQAHWNTLPLFGSHQVLIVLLFCLLWADCSGRPSIDWWLARRRHQPRRIENVDLQPMWPLRLVQLHVGFIYLNSGLWKILGPEWRDGSAVHYVLNLNSFHRFPVAPPPGLEWIATLVTYLTLFWELSFVFMMFHPWTRRAALAMGVLMHVGMGTALELGTFSWLMITSYLAFLDPDAVSHFVTTRRLRQGASPPTDPVTSALSQGASRRAV